MPFSVHPSGYAIFYPEGATENLKHDNGGAKQFGASRSRRGKFFDRCTGLYFTYRKLHLWTFTIPEQQKNFKVTDGQYTALFSKLTENYKKRGLIKDYVYVCEAQKRGNIHFHLVTPAEFIPIKEVVTYWCKLLGTPYSTNSVNLSRMNNKPERLPAYLAKYMSKAMDGKKYKNSSERGKNMKGRIIYARSFNSSRALNVWDKIQVPYHELPLHLQHTKKETPMEVEHLDRTTGELTKRSILKTEYYFNSMDLIRYYGDKFVTKPVKPEKISRFAHEFI